MRDGCLLLKQFLRNPTQVGAIAPSGAKLCRELTGWLELEQCSAVVELGPGTGVVTERILSSIGKDTRFFAVELDGEICRRLSSKLPEVKLYNADACDLPELCRKENLPELDVVISGLPWAVFPEYLQCKLLEAISGALKNQGKFSTFAYIQGMILPGGARFRRLLNRYFSHVELSQIVWKNLPPAVVYRCIK